MSARAPRKLALPILLAAVTGASCGRTEVAAADSKLVFVDRAASAGLDVVSVSGDPRRWYIPESNGCGAAWLDYDGDGDMDLFVGNGQGMRYHDDGRRLEVLRTATSRLYRNDRGAVRQEEESPGGVLVFKDVSEETGTARTDWVNGVAVGDVDNDGDPDLYLACFGPDVFLRNDGGRFVDATEEAGLGNELWAAAAAFGDVDNDGHLDLYVANYCQFDPEHPPLEGRRNVIEAVEVGWGPEEENKQGANAGAPDVLFFGDGKGGFVDGTARAGLGFEKSCSYAVVFTDIDADGRQDILVANDLQPSLLLHNMGGRRFSEEGVQRGFAFDGDGKATGAMGLATEDFDGDGDIDVFRTNFDFESNGLHVNDGNGRFRESSAAHGLARPSMNKLGWGAGWFDADCDGDLDLLVANGHVYPQANDIGMSPWLQASQLFEAVPGEGGRISFVDATERPGLEDLRVPRSARGVAFGDPDDDGDVDCVIIDLDHPPRLLINESERRGNWLAVRLVGTASNRDGIGARVTVRAGGRAFVREMKLTQGLYSSHDPRLHFGLGPVGASGAPGSVASVEVHWPSGRRSLVEGPALDAFLTITEPAAPAAPGEPGR